MPATSVFSLVTGLSSATIQKFSSCCSTVFYGFSRLAGTMSGSGAASRQALTDGVSAYGADMTANLGTLSLRPPPAVATSLMNSFTQTIRNGHLYLVRTALSTPNPGLQTLAQEIPETLLLALVKTFPNGAKLIDSTGAVLADSQVLPALRAGARIKLGTGSIITTSPMLISETGTEFMINFTAKTTKVHLFTGAASWTARVSKADGAFALEWAGKGRGPLMFDSLNNYVGCELFQHMGKVYGGVARELAKMNAANIRAQLPDFAKLSADAVSSADASVAAQYRCLSSVDSLTPMLIKSKPLIGALYLGAGAVIAAKAGQAVQEAILNPRQPMLTPQQERDVTQDVSRVESAAASGQPVVSQTPGTPGIPDEIKPDEVPDEGIPDGFPGLEGGRDGAG